MYYSRNDQSSKGDKFDRQRASDRFELDSDLSLERQSSFTGPQGDRSLFYSN